MIATSDELLHELRLAGHAAAPAPATAAAATHATDRPWYIGLILGVAGWFAGIFLLIFVAILFKPTTGGAGIVLGLVLLAAAWGMFMADRDGAFVSQLALALSIAGQFAILFGANEAMFKGSRLAGFAFTALALQLVLVFAMPNRLHRTMSTLFACCAWALSIRYGLWDHHGLNRFGVANATGASLGPALLGWLLVWAPVGGLLYLLIRSEPAWMAARRQDLVRPVATGLIVSLGFATLLSHPLESFTWAFGAGQRIGWLALWPLLSAFASLGALAAAFAIGSRGLMGLCVVVALVHASHFYYAMGTSLLVKSVIMLALGAALLAAAHAARRPAAP